VTFDGLAAPPGARAFPALVSWSEHCEEAIRHFAGRATYRTRFSLPEAGGRLWRELGDVRDAAQVRVNGREAGVAWTTPWRVEVTGLVHVGENDLEVTVANNWPNRLVGDAQLRRTGGSPLTWSNYADAWNADEPLRPAGLLGPVRLTAAP